MAETETVVKDPTRKRFWTARNILLIITTAILPVAGTGAWDKMASFLASQEALHDQVVAQDALLKEIDERLKDKAVWSSMTEIKNEQIRLLIEIKVLQKLFDREFARSDAGARPDPQALSKELKELLEKAGKPDTFKVEEYRGLLQKQYPNEQHPPYPPSPKK